MNNRANKTMKSSLFSGNGRRSGGAKNNNNNDNNHNQQQDDTEDVLRENDTMLNALGDATAKMHSEAGRLRGEVKEHNEIVAQLLKGIGSASNSVRGTVSKLDQVMARHGCSGTVALAFIVFFVFIFLYYFTKWAWHQSQNSSPPPTPAPVPSMTMVPPPPPL